MLPSRRSATSNAWDKCDRIQNRISVLVMNRTTSVPKSVLRYDVDNDVDQDA